MKIAVGCDPNAQQAKEEIIAYIQKNNLGEVTDFGSEDPIYARVAVTVAEAVSRGEYDRGILICGTGIGIGIAAGLLVVFILKGQLTSVRKQNQAAAYIKQGSMNVTVRRDTFMYRNVTRTKKETSSSSSGSGGGSRNVGGGSF